MVLWGMNVLQRRIFFSNVQLSLLIILHREAHIKRGAQISKRNLNNVYFLKGKVMLFFPIKS